MFKVVCVNDEDQQFDDCPKIKRGNIYHVFDEYMVARKREVRDSWVEAGVYYFLVEIGADVTYRSDMFIKINDEKQSGEVDETEFVCEQLTERQLT